MKKTYKHIAIVGNGELEKELLGDIKKHDYIIGVDKAAWWLIEHKIPPDSAIGDFDSVSQKELGEIKEKVKSVNEFPAEKNVTDLELALESAISLAPEFVDIYGVLGGRVDHELSAIDLLTAFQKSDVKIVIRNTRNTIRLVDAEVPLKKGEHTYFSVLPVSVKAVVTLAGCKYSVEKLEIRRGQSIGVSNEISGSAARVVVHSGKVLVIQSKDK